MKDILQETIKLAHQNPELRGLLVPKIRQVLARAPNWKGTISGDKMRVRWTDPPSSILIVEELPTKPLRRRLRQADFSMGRVFPGMGTIPTALMLVNLVKDARLSSSMSYEQAVKALKKTIDSAKKESKDVLADYESKMLDQMPLEKEVFYLEVEPADYQELVVSGKDFSLTSRWNEFKAYSPRGIDPQEFMGDFIKDQTKGGARKLYKMLKAQPDLIKNVPWSKFTDWLRKNKIGYDYVSSQWR